MAADFPPVPPAVIKFAELQKGEKVYYSGKYKQYSVYFKSNPELEKGDWGLPSYILYDGENLEWVYGEDALSIEITN